MKKVFEHWQGEDGCCVIGSELPRPAPTVLEGLKFDRRISARSLVDLAQQHYDLHGWGKYDCGSMRPEDRQALASEFE